MKLFSIIQTGRKKQYLFLLIVAGACSCTQAYNPPISKNSSHYLVVDGFINSGSDSTMILLSRAEPLSDSQYAFNVEAGAQLTVEGSGSDSYTVSELGNGRYGAIGLNLNPQETYRLRILTTNGEQFLSDYVSVLANPPIDSVNWQQQPDGLHIFINTHDPTNQIRNFRWEYTETWEYQSRVGSDLSYLGNGQVVLVDSATQVHTCWNIANSTGINLGSTSKLSQAVVYQQPLTFIPNGSIKLTDIYSILVRQYPLSDVNYQYWMTLQKNSEELGNIFAPLPSTVTGNIHSLTHPGEPVLGFIAVGNVRQQRIYIINNQLQNWVYEYQTNCHRVITAADSLDFYYGMGWRLVSQVGVSSVLVSEADCVDCRLLGGSTTKPRYWPY